MKLTIVQLAEMYQRATARINSRVEAHKNNRKSVFYSHTDERKYANDMEVLERTANRLKSAIINNL